MKVVIIGSEGFIGRELRGACHTAGIDVVGVDTVTSSFSDHITADITIAGLADGLPHGADAVVHLAALSRDSDCAREPQRAVAVNVIGALNAFEAARALGAAQFIFASTEWVYGDVTPGRPQTEDAVLNPGNLQSEYALTKLFAEQLLRLGHARAPTIALTILRLAIVYGPRPSNWSAVEQLFDTIRTGDQVSVRGSLRTARRFIHVSDVASGILAALANPLSETINLSGASLVTLRDVISASAQVLGKNPKVIEGDPSAVTVRDPDNEKAHRLLGWSPQVDLIRGLMSLQTQ